MFRAIENNAVVVGAGPAGDGPRHPQADRPNSLLVEFTVQMAQRSTTRLLLFVDILFTSIMNY